MTIKVDIDGSYGLFNNVADAYSIADESVYPYLLNTPSVVTAGWFCLFEAPSNSIALTFLPDGNGSIGFSSFIGPSGVYQMQARSRNAGTVDTISFGNAYTNYPRIWQHYIHQADFANKVHSVWLQGKLAARNTGVAWNDSSFQLTPAGGSNLRFGANLAGFNGKLAKQYIGSANGTISDANAFAWYAAGIVPANVYDVIDLSFINGILPVESKQNFTVTPTGAAAPYGAQASLYGGLGR